MIEAQIIDQMTQDFMTVLRENMGVIKTTATRLFYFLAVIQLCITALWMTIAGEPLQRFLAQMISLTFSFGFFYTMIESGGTWIPALLNGFIDLGQQGGLQSLDPSSIIEQGIAIAGGIAKGFLKIGILTHLFVGIVGAIVCLLIIIIYAFIAAELAIILVKSYILVTTSGLFFAFGAHHITRPVVIHYFRTVLGLGLQLMTLYFLLSVGQQLGVHWASLTVESYEQHNLSIMFVILSAVIIYSLILKTVPSFVATISGVGGLQGNSNPFSVATSGIK
jgi:type IV secretion system protein TrbL